MTGNSPPSSNPADRKDLAGLLRLALRKELEDTDKRLPVQVVAYDRVTNRATVQHLIMTLNTSGVLVEKGQVASVPGFRYGGGGFGISVPSKVGDYGWLEACDRDISLFLERYKQSGPNTDRVHSFSDGVFVPDAMTGWTISSDNALNLVIQKLDGTVCIALSENQIILEAPGGVLIKNSLTVQGPLIAQGGMNVSGGGGSNVAQFDGGLILNTGDIRVASGNITASGDITPHVP
jgi:hypothetical protein